MKIKKIAIIRKILNYKKMKRIKIIKKIKEINKTGKIKGIKRHNNNMNKMLIISIMVI